MGGRRSNETETNDNDQHRRSLFIGICFIAHSLYYYLPVLVMSEITNLLASVLQHFLQGPYCQVVAAASLARVVEQLDTGGKTNLQLHIFFFMAIFG